MHNINALSQIITAAALRRWHEKYSSKVPLFVESKVVKSGMGKLTKHSISYVMCEGRLIQLRNLLASKKNPEFFMPPCDEKDRNTFLLCNSFFWGTTEEKWIPIISPEKEKSITCKQLEKMLTEGGFCSHIKRTHNSATVSKTICACVSPELSKLSSQLANEIFNSKQLRFCGAYNILKHGIKFEQNDGSGTWFFYDTLDGIMCCFVENSIGAAFINHEQYKLIVKEILSKIGGLESLSLTEKQKRELLFASVNIETIQYAAASENLFSNSSVYFPIKLVLKFVLCPRYNLLNEWIGAISFLKSIKLKSTNPFSVFLKKAICESKAGYTGSTFCRCLLATLLYSEVNIGNDDIGRVDRWYRAAYYGNIFIKNKLPNLKKEISLNYRRISDAMVNIETLKSQLPKERKSIFKKASHNVTMANIDSQLRLILEIWETLSTVYKEHINTTETRNASLMEVIAIGVNGICEQVLFLLNNTLSSCNGILDKIKYQLRVVANSTPKFASSLHAMYDGFEIIKRLRSDRIEIMHPDLTTHIASVPIYTRDQLCDAGVLNVEKRILLKNRAKKIEEQKIVALKRAMMKYLYPELLANLFIRLIKTFLVDEINANLNSKIFISLIVKAFKDIVLFKIPPDFIFIDLSKSVHQIFFACAENAKTSMNINTLALKIYDVLIMPLISPSIVLTCDETSGRMMSVLYNYTSQCKTKCEEMEAKLEEKKSLINEDKKKITPSVSTTQVRNRLNTENTLPDTIGGYQPLPRHCSARLGHIEKSTFDKMSELIMDKIRTNKEIAEFAKHINFK